MGSQRIGHNWVTSKIRNWGQRPNVFLWYDSCKIKFLLRWNSHPVQLSILKCIIQQNLVHLWCYTASLMSNVLSPHPHSHLLTASDLLCVSGFACCGHFMQKEWHSTQPFVCGFFPWASCSQGSPSCAVCQCFIAFYGWIIFHCFNTHPHTSTHIYSWFSFLKIVT